MKNWMPTAAGFLAAFGLLLSQMDNPTVKMVGLILGAAGTALLGIVTKQFNVTGGAIPQASPPGVKLKSDALGVIAVVDAIQAKEGVTTFSERAVKAEAQAVVDTPASLAIVDALKK